MASPGGFGSFPICLAFDARGLKAVIACPNLDMIAAAAIGTAVVRKIAVFHAAFCIRNLHRKSPMLSRARRRRIQGRLWVLSDLFEIALPPSLVKEVLGRPIEPHDYKKAFV